jgi:hypothetical protein
MKVRLTKSTEFRHWGTTLNNSWIRTPNMVLYSGSGGKVCTDQFSENKALLHIIKTIGICR